MEKLHVELERFRVVKGKEEKEEKAVEWTSGLLFVPRLKKIVKKQKRGWGFVPAPQKNGRITNINFFIFLSKNDKKELKNDNYSYILPS